eukprot:Skav230531  [mRNA]  locus=scaffold1183:160256:166954:+ [translate_table: standard]
MRREPLKSLRTVPMQRPRRQQHTEISHQPSNRPSRLFRVVDSTNGNRPSATNSGLGARSKKTNNADTEVSIKACRK